MANSQIYHISSQLKGSEGVKLRVLLPVVLHAKQPRSNWVKKLCYQRAALISKIKIDENEAMYGRKSDPQA